MHTSNHRGLGNDPVVVLAKTKSLVAVNISPPGLFQIEFATLSFRERFAILSFRGREAEVRFSIERSLLDESAFLCWVPHQPAISSVRQRKLSSGDFDALASRSKDLNP